jgi:hypothetical protein
MSKMIQIRNVPDDLHRRLKARAAQEGMSLSDYLLRMAEREAGRVSIAELSERIERRGRVDLGDLPTRIIRETRDAAG